MASVAYPRPGRWRVIAALGGLVAGVRDVAVRLQRANWRRQVETILMDELGWSLEDAVTHTDLIEDLAEELLRVGTIRKWPKARDAVRVSDRMARSI